MARGAWYRGGRGNHQAKADAPVIDALNALLERNPRWGFWKCFGTLRNRGYGWNHKRVWRVYCSLGLNQKRRMKNRLPDRPRQPLEVPADMKHPGRLIS